MDTKLTFADRPLAILPPLKGESWGEGEEGIRLLTRGPLKLCPITVPRWSEH